MKPNELLQTTWRERNREWIWRIYLPPQIVPTLNNPSATDVVSPGGCAKAWLGQSMGVDKVWFMMVHVVVQACACLLVPCQLAGSAWTTPTILSCLRHPAFYCAFLACLSLAWNVPLLHKKTGFFELHLQPITSQSGIFWTWHACSGKLMEVSHHYWTSPYFPQIFAYWNVDIFITWIFSISRPWRNGRWRCWSECCPVTCRSFTKSMVIGSRNCSKGDRLQPGELSSFSGAEWSYEPRSWCFM